MYDKLAFHLENINCESLNDNSSKFSIECSLHVLEWRPQHSVLSLQLIVGCTGVVAVVIPYVRCVHEVQLPVHDGLVCQNMLHRMQIRLHDWPWKIIHGFPLKVGGHCPWTMRPGVVIHKYKLVGGCRNGELQLVARHLWCSDHPLCFLV
jgi:hypothetical protein